MKAGLQAASRSPMVHANSLEGAKALAALREEGLVRVVGWDDKDISKANKLHKITDKGLEVLNGRSVKPEK